MGNESSTRANQANNESEFFFSPPMLLSLFMFGVILVVLFVHWPALHAQALYLDDTEYLLNNPLIRNPNARAVGRVFTEVLRPSTVDGYYQPLTMVSLMLDTALGGSPQNLAPYHGTSLLFHLANTALVILLFYLLFRQPWIAAAMGLFFGLHPICVESIPWVTDRKTLLATFFSLLALVAYLRYVDKKTKTLYLAVLGFYILGLLSKPTSTPLPVLLLVLDFWPLRRLSFKSFLEKIPFFLVGLLSAGVTIFSQGQTAGLSTPAGHSGSQIFFLVSHNIIFYLQKFLWPAGITWYYSFPSPFSLASPAVLRGVVGTVILLPLLVLSLRWTRSLLAGWLFFFLAIFPSLGLLQFTPVIAANRFAYFPMIGFLLPLAGGLVYLWNTSRPPRRRLLIRIAIGAVVLLAATGESFATRHYLSYWRDNLTLGGYMLKTSGNKPFFYNQIGNAQEALGNLDQAVTAYRLSLKYWPKYGIAHYNLASALMKQNHLDEAIAHLKEALRLNPHYFDAQLNLCVMLAKNGDLAAAAIEGEKAVRLKPNHYLAHYTLGRIYRAEKDYDGAIRELKKAIDLIPNYPDANYHLVITYYYKKDYDQAYRALEEIRRKGLPLKFDPVMIEVINRQAGSGK